MAKSVGIQKLQGSVYWGQNGDGNTPSARLQELYDELAVYKKQRLSIIQHGASWSLKNGDDTRAITNVSLSHLNKLIADTERQIVQLESGVSSGAIRLIAEV